jgi:hypothetical protein
VNRDNIEFKVRFTSKIFNIKLHENGEFTGFEDVYDEKDRDDYSALLEIIKTVWKNYNYLI